jgi:capsular exopolysaccharide synthesis family protein
MERLHVALSRYREQQRTRTPQPPPEPATDAPSYRRDLAIVYTRTRTIQIPGEHLREQRLLSAFPEGTFVDAYKLLRTQVMHRLKENGWNVLAVTSPGRGEGKTLTAINLALALALDVTQTVLLVDADLRNPGVAHAFGIDGAKGLADYLVDQAPLEDLLIHPSIGRFVLLPSGRRVLNSTETLTSPRMVSLLHEMKHRYPSRVIVFDLPPLLEAADVIAFAPSVDAMLLVVEERRTTREEVERALQLLKGAAPVIGTVLNKSVDGGRGGKRGGAPMCEAGGEQGQVSGSPDRRARPTGLLSAFLMRRKTISRS